MKQTNLGLDLTTKRTRKCEFLAQMERVVPWAALMALVQPHAPPAKTGRRPFGIEAMLRVQFMQQWFTLSDPAKEESLHGVPLFREFASLNWDSRIPDESTILRLRHLLEKHGLTEKILAAVQDLLHGKGLLFKAGTVVDSTLISAASSTKNQAGVLDPVMKQSKKGYRWHFGMKAHISVDAESGLVHTVMGSSGNVNDAVPADSLLHCEEREVFADAGYRDSDKRPGARQGVIWQFAQRPSSRKPFKKEGRIGESIDKIAYLKASVRFNVEDSFRVIQRQFGHVQERNRDSRRTRRNCIRRSLWPTSGWRLASCWYWMNKSACRAREQTDSWPRR
jgi:IS5 family transposase